MPDNLLCFEARRTANGSWREGNVGEKALNTANRLLGDILKGTLILGSLTYHVSCKECGSVGLGVGFTEFIGSIGSIGFLGLMGFIRSIGFIGFMGLPVYSREHCLPHSEVMAKP